VIIFANIGIIPQLPTELPEKLLKHYTTLIFRGIRERGDYQSLNLCLVFTNTYKSYTILGHGQKFKITNVQFRLS